MKTVVCALYDKKAQCFKTPFYLPRLEMAARSLSGAVNSPEKNDLSEYPEDFALYHLATYDDETGNFRNETPPVFVAEASQFKKPAASIAAERASGPVRVSPTGDPAPAPRERSKAQTLDFLSQETITKGSN